MKRQGFGGQAESQPLCRLVLVVIGTGLSAWSWKWFWVVPLICVTLTGPI